MPKYLPHDVCQEAELEDYGINDNPLSTGVPNMLDQCEAIQTGDIPLGRFDSIDD